VLLVNSHMALQPLGPFAAAGGGDGAAALGEQYPPIKAGQQGGGTGQKRGSCA
jgi:hypothetical protein